MTFSGAIPKCSTTSGSHRIRPMYVDRLPLQTPTVPPRRATYVPWRAVPGGAVAALAHRRAATVSTSASLFNLSGLAHSQTPSVIRDATTQSEAVNLPGALAAIDTVMSDLVNNYESVDECSMSMD